MPAIVASSQKYQLLAALLAQTNFDSVLIFSAHQHGADKIARRLKNPRNHAVPHCTPIAPARAVRGAGRVQVRQVRAHGGHRHRARGIDVEDISHVINYDVPQHPEICSPHRPDRPGP